MRWSVFADFVYLDVLDKDPYTKEGKEEVKTLDLGAVDYSVLSDGQLLSLFQFMCRKYYAQM